MKLREGDGRDVAAVLDMLDGAVAWLVSQGRNGQWGSEPFSGDAKRVAQVTGWAEGDGMRIAEIDGLPAGCVVVGAANHYVKPATEPELYVQALVTDRRHAGRGVGAALLAWAEQEAVARGVGLLRVDCYAGHDGRLIAYYESRGFTRAEPFTVGSWPGMLLHKRLG
ncbi:GNAT family N-acetyltransferase [Nonomuraea sp. NPDC000554]|uniref:GNAT family N-acetyltransferase n=1 Tax=Nonomuraea sp. NPDC000554 TaxID=3154259 RepID=UPI00332ADCBC